MVTSGPCLCALILALTASAFAPCSPAQRKSAATHPPAQAASPYEEAREPSARNRIDQLVFAHLRELGIRPARPCSDAVYLRRVHLDLCGTLPTAAEARAFLDDRDPRKRQLLVDRLLASDDFAAFQAMRWCDVLRVKSEFPINLWPNAAQAYDAWIREQWRSGVTFDRFVRALLTASGSNFRVPPVNFYRAVQGRDPETIARAVALTFLGQRAERWSSARLAGFAGFFRQLGFKQTAEWKEEIVFHDPAAASRTAVFPDGSPAELAPGQDPREVFADWLVRNPDSGLARCFANRMWAWLVGRGIVHEPDDLRPDNPPSQPAMLDWLTRQVVDDGYDPRKLCRLICASQTYALSCIPRSPEADCEAVFACAPLRRLEAEVLIDAIDRITGTSERYTSVIPEPFTFLPPQLRSIEIPDGSITGPFLEMYGRPARDTGLWAERSEACSAEQRLHMLNSSHVQRKLEQGPGLRTLLQSRQEPRALVETLYLTVLSRYPSDRELDVVAAFAREAEGDRRQHGLDLVWALVNSAEFLYRH